MISNNYKAEKIDVQSAVIIKYEREVITDIKKILVDFNVYEDLFSPNMTFTATILDSNGLIERFPFIGEELVAISFKSQLICFKNRSRLLEILGCMTQ